MPPVVVRAGALDGLPPGAMALGSMADATFTDQRVELSEGDALIVFSDGVSEAMNSSGDFFGDERIGAVIQGAAGEPAAEIGDRLRMEKPDLMLVADRGLARALLGDRSAALADLRFARGKGAKSWNLVRLATALERSAGADVR